MIQQDICVVMLCAYIYYYLAIIAQFVMPSVHVYSQPAHLVPNDIDPLHQSNLIQVTTQIFSYISLVQSIQNKAKNKHYDNKDPDAD